MDETVGAATAVFLLGLYSTPTIIILFRSGHHLTGPVIIINLLLGWTIIGWIVALAMACTANRNDTPVQVYYPPQQEAPPQPPARHRPPPSASPPPTEPPPATTGR